MIPRTANLTVVVIVLAALALNAWSLARRPNADLLGVWTN